MDNDYTHISVILDRTGSMEEMRDDIIGGFNAFLDDQRAGPGRATLTLVQFDSQDPYQVIHRFMPIELVPKLTRQTYVPRANTPLLDGVGRGINDTEQAIAGLREDRRPGQVLMVIITDGYEKPAPSSPRAGSKGWSRRRRDRAGISSTLAPTWTPSRRPGAWASVVRR